MEKPTGVTLDFVPEQSGNVFDMDHDYNKIPFCTPTSVIPGGADEYPDPHAMFDSPNSSECYDITDEDDDDWITENRKVRVADWDHCNPEDYYRCSYSSSEESVLPSDAEEEGEIPELPRRKLSFRNEDIASTSNVQSGDAWVASTMFQYMKERHSTRALTIKNKVFRMKGVRISIKRARHARHMCLDDIFVSGSYERSFREIPDLCYRIRAQNPGSIACWKINRKTKEFEGLYIAYKASIDGFKNGCRPLIALDGFPLKTKFRGAVLTACSVDGENAMYTVAIYICRTETLQAWRRFLTIIAASLKEFSKPITFFSDHKKGVNVAVAENFKDVVHHQRRCFRKMYKKEILTCIVNKSWDMQFSLESLAWKPPAAYNFKSFKRAMSELESTSVLARLELEIHPTETWARYAFDQSARCPHIFNIFSQSFQDWIVGLKCSPIVTWVIEYTKQLGDMFFHRRWLGCEDKMQEHGIVPQAARCVEIYLNWVTDCHVLPGDVAEHWSVTHGSYGTETVNLSQWNCSCGEWAATGIPCVHVLVVVVHQGRDDYDKVVDDYFTVGKYRAAYAGAIPCVPEINWKHVRGPKAIVKPPPMFPGYED